MIIGSIGAIATGASFPVMLIFFGNIIDNGVSYTSYSKVCNNLTTIATTTISAITATTTTTAFIDPAEIAKLQADQFLETMKEQAIYLTSKILLKKNKRKFN